MVKIAMASIRWPNETNRFITELKGDNCEVTYIVIFFIKPERIKGIANWWIKAIIVFLEFLETLRNVWIE